MCSHYGFLDLEKEWIIITIPQQHEIRPGPDRTYSHDTMRDGKQARKDGIHYAGAGQSLAVHALIGELRPLFRAPDAGPRGAGRVRRR